jgi:hypothetical protein
MIDTDGPTADPGRGKRVQTFDGLTWKWCLRCKEWWPNERLFWWPHRGGFHSWCIACCNEWQAEKRKRQRG